MTIMDLTSIPSHSLEAEQALLGSLIAVPTLIGDVSAILGPQDFYDAKHESIMETLLWMSNEGHPIEVPALITRLRDTGDLDRLGGADYIVRIARQASVQSATYYATTIAEKAAKRRIANIHMHGMRKASDGNGLSVADLVGETQNELDKIIEERGGNDVVRVSSAFDSTIDKIEELGKSKGGVTGLSTGFYELDRMTYGLHGGQMIVVAARPGVGKSTLGLDFLRAAAIKHQQPAVLFSLEMSVEEIEMRLISAQAGVELGHIRSGQVQDHEWERISRKREQIMDAPLFIDDTANNTMSQIRTKSRRLHARYGLKLIVIDYLQLMNPDKRTDSRQNDVAEMSRACKLLAKELKIPVVVMSQLNRGSEQRGDGRPKVSDLRESGAIEQDSDVVMLIHREEISDPESPRVGEADIILGKQRSAPQGVCVLGWQGAYSRFADMARDDL